MDRRLTRRAVLGAAVAGGLAWVPAFRVLAAESTDPPPPGFPAEVPLHRQAYENWAHAIVVDDLWTCVPRTQRDVATLATWAAAHGWRLRPCGQHHGWSPTTITADTTSTSRVVLVDTSSLSAMRVVPADRAGGLAAVTLEAGALLDDVHVLLQGAGLGLLAIPAPGNLTIGGALAVDAHGAGIPAVGERRPAGATYGTLSNLVTSFTAVCWDERRRRYALTRIERSDPRAKAFLVHLGRAFITEVTLRVTAATNLRCVSTIDVTGAELFAPQGSPGRTFASYLEASGRIESIWFPFTDKPWLKTWTVAPTKPARSRAVNAPYNYPFSDQIPRQVGLLAEELVEGRTDSTPAFGKLSYAVSATGLRATRSLDLWGPAKDVQLYVRPTTLQLTQQSWSVVTRRRDVQRVVSEFTAQCLQIIDAYAARGLYPVNGPIEIRVSGLDRPTDVGIPGAEAPVLSAAAPEPGHPEWDVAVWCGILTFAGTPSSFEAMRELETWVYATFTGSFATVRPEWSKAWAFTGDAAWADPRVLGRLIPDAFRCRRDRRASWDWAVATLDAADPHRVFTNPFLDVLLR